MNEIKLNVEWIKRLKYYTNKIKDTREDDEVGHKFAVISLLGYLDSLEHLIKEEVFYQAQGETAGLREALINDLLKYEVQNSRNIKKV